MSNCECNMSKKNVRGSDDLFSSYEKIISLRAEDFKTPLNDVIKKTCPDAPSRKRKRDEFISPRRQNYQERKATGFSSKISFTDIPPSGILKPIAERPIVAV